MTTCSAPLILRLIFQQLYAAKRAGSAAKNHWFRLSVVLIAALARIDLVGAAWGTLGEVSRRLELPGRQLHERLPPAAQERAH